jgi:hypothetical protein
MKFMAEKLPQVLMLYSLTGTHDNSKRGRV